MAVSPLLHLDGTEVGDMGEILGPFGGFKSSQSSLHMGHGQSTRHRGVVDANNEVRKGEQ